MASEFQVLCDSFASFYQKEDFVNCDAALLKIKLFACKENIDPCNYSPDRASLFINLRSVYEICIRMSISQKRADLFIHYMKPLKAFYFDLESLLPKSQNFEHIFGLNLMYLLAFDLQNEFHDDLQRIPFTMLTNSSYVRIPWILEQHLLEGNYSLARGMIKEMPSDDFLFFYNRILETVRNRIAEACMWAYKKLPNASLVRMLDLQNDPQTFENLAKEYNWTVTDTETLFSCPSKVNENDKELEAEFQLRQLIKLTSKLETIV
ncbi:26S proteasome regulatory subunit rpn12 [Thelohanellus kitauei]|uniref:26S proteasome regulatory subunit rpn12 n=1 Tax=Thelohanellus kitauei TaxID=669202 RepID=A0A0C2MIA9_THEKT|nr:26S proteasome regulatory subunit rpn12 [Thelohanellus kitauei]